MTLRTLLFLFFAAGMAFHAFAQSYCISGRVVDSETKKPVPDIHLWASRSERGTITDRSGSFQICGEGDDVLVLSHTAYQSKRVAFNYERNDTLTIVVEKKEILTDEVKITGQRDVLIDKSVPATGQIARGDILRLPSVLGEADVVSALRQLPGIQSVGEGIGGIYVRGGSPGQNRVLLDGMELMNPVHLMGAYSVFNPLTTEDVSVYKGHSPVSVRSGLSSSIIVSSGDPLSGFRGVMGSLGNIASNLTFSSRSRNEKFGITAGLRRSYLELYRGIAGLFLSEEENYFKRSFYSFYDFNGKMVFQPQPGSRFTLSWYVGKDDFKIDDDELTYDAGTNYGNNAAALQWVKRTGSNGSLKVSAGYTSAWSDFKGEIIQNDLDFKSRHQKLSFGAGMTNEYEKHLLRYGVGGAWYKTTPQDMHLAVLEDTTSYKDVFRNSEVTLYFEDTYRLTPDISLYAGVRGFYYASWGPYQYDNDDVFINSNNGEIADQKWYWSYSAALSYAITGSDGFKIAWTRPVQMRHLATLSSMPLPNDLWMMASPRLEPQMGHQWSVGYERETPVFSFSTGAFVRLMQNQVIFNVNIDGNEMNFEDHFFHGKGRAWGIEFSAKKNIGDLRGNINYTLSKSERSFPDIFDGAWFNDKFDRTHDLSLMSSFKLSEKWSFSANWTYATGMSMTLPSGRMWMMGSIMNDYDGYNNFRLPPYHRLDLSASLRLKSNTFKESTLDFSVINAYNRANPYFVFYKVIRGDSNYDIDIRAAQVSLFPLMPSVSWKFKF